jgi:hypothetical protein
LKTGNIKSNEFFISWDKIGAGLFNNYTEKVEVSERRKLRNEIQQEISQVSELDSFKNKLSNEADALELSGSDIDKSIGQYIRLFLIRDY